MKKSILRTELEKMEGRCCGSGPCSTMEPVRELVDNVEKVERLFRDRVAALLKRIESIEADGLDWCPNCNQPKGSHASDCELAALLKECESA